ncbi:MAG: cytochrome b/b6 domain-containing protein [Thermodesulfobacteriota bacterium]|nr:cytochrome b/b6 domain-containing protein [Thermodesulfobacteriota bacterium]
MTEKTVKSKKKIKRHGLSVLLVHWTVAISTSVLIFSGLGQMPLYKRYMIDRLPGLSWVIDYSITLSIHYWAATALIFAIVYHIVFHVMRREFDMLPRRGDMKQSAQIIMAVFGFGQEPENDKYLAEQRLAYVFIGFSLLILVFTGTIKVLKNLPDINFSEGFIYWITQIHNLGTLLIIIGVVVHLGAFIFKENWPMLPGIFTGKIDLEYARRRHSIWYNRVFGKKQ